MKPILYSNTKSLEHIVIFMLLKEKDILQHIEIFPTVQESVKNYKIPVLFDQETFIQSLDIILLYLNERYFFPELLSDKHLNWVLLRYFINKLSRNLHSKDLDKVFQELAGYMSGGFVLSESITILDCMLYPLLLMKHRKRKITENPFLEYMQYMDETVSLNLEA